MITKKVILIILSFMAFNSTFGQGIKKTKYISGIDFTQAINETQYQNTSTFFCDTIFSFKTRPMPSGLTWDGQYLWYVDTSYIYKVSSTGIYLDSIINPAVNVYFKGGGLAYDGLNLWYADEESAKLFKINPSSGNVLQQFNLPSFGQSDPNGFGLTWDGVNLWHSQYIPPRLYKLNPTNGIIIDSLTTTSGILGIVWIDGKLYGISGQQILKISPNNGTVEDTMDWCVPFPLGLTWDGFSLWNVSGPDSICGIHTGGKQKIYEINSDIILSFDENTTINNGVDIFPNPTTDKIFISSDFLYQNFKILSVTGINVKSGKVDHNSVDLSELKPGVYFIKIEGNKPGNTRVTKLIKK